VSDWSYITLAYIVGWGGVTAYAVFLARRIFQARRLEEHLRNMSGIDPTEDREPAWSGPPESTLASASTAAGRRAEGDRSACDVPPAS
jgi:hypothetical protein